MTWKQDRIYVFLEAGLNYNTNQYIHFYFDMSDKLFFRLYNDNGDVKLSPITPFKISKENLVLLNIKIEKVKANSSDIIEIEPLATKIIDPDRGMPSKNPEDFNRRFKIGQELAKWVTLFLDTNKIDISSADVIEY